MSPLVFLELYGVITRCRRKDAVESYRVSGADDPVDVLCKADRKGGRGQQSHERTEARTWKAMQDLSRDRLPVRLRERNAILLPLSGGVAAVKAYDIDSLTARKAALPMADAELLYLCATGRVCRFENGQCIFCNNPEQHSPLEPGRTTPHILLLASRLYFFFSKRG